MSEPQRHLGGRPSKRTHEFLAPAYDVIDQDDNALIYRDAELLFALNEKLSTEAEICKKHVREVEAPERGRLPTGVSLADTPWRMLWGWLADALERHS
jgi:hypothetical protein